MRALPGGIARKSAGLGPGGRPKSGITEGFVDGSWASGGAGGADRLQAELRAASRYGLAPLRNLLGHWPCLRRSRPGSAMTGHKGECGLNRKIIGGTHRNPMEEGSGQLPNPRAPEKNGGGV